MMSRALAWLVTLLVMWLIPLAAGSYVAVGGYEVLGVLVGIALAYGLTLALSFLSQYMLNRAEGGAE